MKDVEHNGITTFTLTVEIEAYGRIALSQLILRSHLVFASILNCDIFNLKGCEVRVAIFIYPQLQKEYTKFKYLIHIKTPLASIHHCSCRAEFYIYRVLQKCILMTH